MTISRRTLMKVGAAVPALSGAKAFGESPSTLAIYDSRIVASRAFAGRRTKQRIDVAQQDAALWRDLRTALPTGPVEGLTSWSDWVIVRGLLEEQGLRVKQEVKTGGLFRWTMA